MRQLHRERADREVMPGFGAAARLPGHEANRFLAHIVSSSRDAIVATDCEGCILSWNAAAEELFGWPADEVLGGRIAASDPPTALELHDIRPRREHGKYARVERPGS